MPENNIKHVSIIGVVSPSLPLYLFVFSLPLCLCGDLPRRLYEEA